MSDAPTPESPPEKRLNTLLRSVDWRFLLNQRQRPRVLNLSASPRLAQALELIADQAAPEPGSADLVVLGFPSGRKLSRARQALRPGGEVVCTWRRPRIAGAERARKRLRRAGFERVQLHWPGPSPRRPPEFWLPLDSPAALAHLLGGKQPRSRADRALRSLWRLAARTGALPGLCAIARRPAPTEGAGEDALLNTRDPLLLLTEGAELRHKVVGLSFAGAEPALAIKCARIPATDDSLAREARVLEQLARALPHPDLTPRVRAEGKRVGRRVVVESVVPGRLPNSPLTQADFDRLAPEVTRRLLELVGGEPPPSGWRRRLVDEPLERFERRFAERLAPGVVDRMREALAALPELPVTWEHRDCAVWNIHETADGSIGLFDWADSEPHGLPGLDLAYFLATSAFMIDRLEMSDPDAAAASYEPLLDPSSARGAVAARCGSEYCGRLGLDPGIFPLLSLRGWIAKATPDDPAATSYAMLAEAELRRLGERRSPMKD